ncbi:hypothetical protein MPER_08783 [Moniliophthora perniciosa FA553]|nr:hypothetical protein MPER_08783 [Moniliophthora perniciosa FA553]
METGQNLDGPQQIGSLSDLNDVYKRFSDYYILLAGIGLPEVSSTYERDAKVPAGGIAGGAVGGIISVIVVLGICVVCMRRKRQSQAFGGTPFMLQVEDVQPVPYDGTAPTHWHIKSRITERRNGNEADASAGGANATPSSGQTALTLTRQAEPARSGEETFSSSVQIINAACKSGC